MSTVFRCPSCGAALRVEVLGGSGSWQRGHEFALGVPAGAEFSRETPVRDASVESDVRVPLLQALVTASVAGLLATLGVALRGWHWTTPVVVAVVTFALAWWFLLLDHRKLLRRVETLVGADLDGDGQIGNEFRIEITEKLSDGRTRMKFCEFPGRPRDVQRFALAALNGQLTVHGNHRLSRRTFEQLRDEALARGLLAWVNPEARNQGVELTRVGRRVFERMLDLSPSD